MTRYRNAVNNILALLAIGTVIGEANAKPPSRVYGGRLAIDKEFNAAASLADPGSFVHTCGAAIIGPRHVLTAAHCVDYRINSDIVVRAGVRDIRDTSNAVERLVSKAIIHPGYLPQIVGVQDIQNDLAILVLGENLPIGDRITAYKLPTRRPLKGFYNYVAAGWGMNHPEIPTDQFELKALTMTLGDASQCYGVYSQTICAYSHSGALCGGDSGSPLARNGYIFGIASTSRCSIGEAANFVNVANYHDWIITTMRQNP